MKILCKFPTRSRPQQLLKVLNLLHEKATDKENVFYLITFDNDDTTMTHQLKCDVLDMTGRQAMIGGTSNNKIHACNRDMPVDDFEWDIVVLMSDDMIPQLDGWDDIIRSAMTKYYPDTDGCLWFNDGYQPRICTLVIMGKVYYDRTGYLYHPDYHSLFADNEQTEVAQGLDKMTYFTTVLFKHEHYANNSMVTRDKLYDRNEALFNIDKQTYERRKAQGFEG